ncbi:hypothetical protein MMC20_005097 [Loxospora ochrophaea]|nr:hypothetical protein [Loxospora ochrophaea]
MDEEGKSEIVRTDEIERPREPSAELQEMEQEAQDLKQENSRLSRICANQASEIDDLSRSCTKQASEIDNLSWLLRTYQKDYGNLQRKNIGLQRELQICRDDLFRLQPAIQKPDSEITNQFETLCQKISSWIDQEIIMLEDNSVGQEKELFSVTDNDEIASLLEEFPRSGEFWITAVIHQKIQRAFFRSNIYLFGLPGNLRQLLQNLEQNMVLLEPSRGMYRNRSNPSICISLLRADIASIKEWRSETLKALAKDSQWSSRRSRRIKKFSGELYDYLAPRFLAIDSDRWSFNSIHEQISLSAAQLELDVHLSSSIYSMAEPFNSSRLTKDMLNAIKVIDVKTTRTVKSDNYSFNDDSCTIGRLIICVEPELSRARNDTGEKIVLRKATYLGNLTGKPVDGSGQLIKQERASIG